MRLKTMEAMGLDEAEIMKNLKIQLKEAENKVKVLEERVKADPDDLLLRQELYRATVRVKELEAEIFKRKYLTTT